MGYRQKNEISSDMKKKIDNTIKEAFIYCETKGVYDILPCKTTENSVIVGDYTWASNKLSDFLKGFDHAIVFASTVGVDIVNRRNDFMSDDDLFSAVIYDAVGSEVADDALNWIQEYIKNKNRMKNVQFTKYRFSPGYMDLPLSVQADIDAMIDLSSLGITLNDSFIMHPEKSVTAIAGIKY